MLSGHFPQQTNSVDHPHLASLLPSPLIRKHCWSRLSTQALVYQSDKEPSTHHRLPVTSHHITSHHTHTHLNPYSTTPMTGPGWCRLASRHRRSLIKPPDRVQNKPSTFQDGLSVKGRANSDWVFTSAIFLNRQPSIQPATVATARDINVSLRAPCAWKTPKTDSFNWIAVSLNESACVCLCVCLCLCECFFFPISSFAWWHSMKLC